MTKKAFSWFTKDCHTLPSRGYLKKGQTVEERVRDIADRAEELVEIEGFSDKLYDYMSKGWISLSSPVWSNYGNDKGLPVSCFGSFISDSMESILLTHAEVGMLSKFGGGTSGYFGALRPRGSEIKDNGESSGAVHFMELFDKLTDVVSQGSVRRGYFSAYLDIEHDDFYEFIGVGTEGHPIQNLTTGVCVGDEFMKKVEAKDKEACKRWAKVIQARSEVGFPYIFWKDTVNRNKPIDFMDHTIYASNMCCVTGDQRVVTDKGLILVEDLYATGENLVIFDGEKKHSSSSMKLVRKDKVFKIKTRNGLEHKITKDHKVKTVDGIKTLEQLKIGDKIVIQNKKGLFGNVSMENEAFLLGLYQSDGTQTEKSCHINVWKNDFDLIPEIEQRSSYIYDKYSV